MDAPITMAVHEEFVRYVKAENQRLSEEDKRQNARIAELEENVKEMHKLTVSMERMSANMQSMLKAIERQGNLIEKQTSRIDEIEKEPAKDQKEIRMEVIKTAFSALVGAAVVAILSLI